MSEVMCPQSLHSVAHKLACVASVQDGFAFGSHSCLRKLVAGIPRASQLWSTLEPRTTGPLRARTGSPLSPERQSPTL